MVNNLENRELKYRDGETYKDGDTPISKMLPRKQDFQHFIQWFYQRVEQWNGGKLPDICNELWYGMGSSEPDKTRTTSSAEMQADDGYVGNC